MAKPRTVTLDVSPKVFNPVYLPYLEDTTPTQIFFGGSSSGKSYFLAQRAVLDVAKGGRNYLVTRKVAKTIRTSVFNEIKKAISFFQLTQFFKVNESDLVITCQNGYQILFAGLDDVEKVKSITPAIGVITDIWEEEATEDDYDDHKQLDKRLRGMAKVKKRHIKSFNPIIQEHWIHKEFFKGWTDGSKTYKDNRLSILHTTYRDNKFLTQDDVERLEAETDPYYRDVYVLGKWGVLGAVIFKNWTVEDLSDKRKTFDALHNGLDFGFAADPAGGIRVHYDRKNMTVYVLDEIYVKGMTNDLLAVELRNMCGGEFVTCDSAEPKSIQELRNYGIRALAAKKGKDSINFGIQWLQKMRIVIDVKCLNFKAEIQQYKWKEDKDGNTIPVPIDKNNHLLDALRYALESEMEFEADRRGKRVLRRAGAM